MFRSLVTVSALAVVLSAGCASTKAIVSAANAKYLDVTPDRIELKDAVYFQTGSAEIDAKSNDLLDAVAAVLKENPSIAKVRVEGHTDNVGDAEANKKLSQERAESVVKYLTAKGLDAARLTAVGIGDAEPVAPNDTDENKAKNRRVEIEIVK